jgi:hypothetical protein
MVPCKKTPVSPHIKKNTPFPGFIINILTPFLVLFLWYGHLRAEKVAYEHVQHP